MISYIIPTRDRAERLAETLRAIEGLGPHQAEVVVADNASRVAVRVPRTLGSGLPVRLLELGENLGAAARNVAVRESDSRASWVVMLDDDSHPLGLGFLGSLASQPEDVAAVSADIFLPRHGRRESGGLPEVFIGCGVAIRRGAFLAAGGYDASFNYYAEEYDLAAKLLLAGHRVAFDPAFCVAHHKVEAGRDMNLICERLVRNNGWVMQRYAPQERRREELREIRGRYRAIAEKERAIAGYSRGLVELRRTLRGQMRTPMPRELFDRFTGLSQARAAIAAAQREASFRTAAVVREGKNAWCVRTALAECGVREVTERDAEALVIGTMSPGPMLDAAGALYGSGARVVMPWCEAKRATAIGRAA